MDPGAPTTTCLFCDRLQNAGSLVGRTVYEDALVHVSHQLNDDAPTYLGAVIVQTRRHTEAGLSDLTDAEAERIGLLVGRVSRALRETVGAAWCYTYAFTEGYRHLHQFVVARYPRTPEEFVRLEITDWTDAPRGDRDRVEQLVGELASHLGPIPGDVHSRAAGEASDLRRRPRTGRRP